MSLLVTGANSYIAGYLSDVLDRTGIEYIASDRTDFEYTDIESIRSFFTGKDINAVIHLAGALQNDNFSDLFGVNIYGIYNLLMVCKEKGISHFTFASGNNVYADCSGKSLCETDPCQPDSKNRYAFSKYVGELLIRDVCERTGISFANVRIADVYGPKQKHGNLLKAIVRNIEQGQPLELYGKGTRVRDYVFVKDVAEGLAYISKNKLTGNLNLGTGVGTSVKQLLDIVNDLYSNTLTIEHREVTVEDCSSVVLNCDRLKQRGFYAKYSVIDGMTEILKGIKNE
ncbi:MAG: NAD(P)-dependent oxidoreductase [Oscillospiraceae bacterium]|nr:NAD(P)-dependent oxidoreductase [Oscillospiraceae bacterium]